MVYMKKGLITICSDIVLPIIIFAGPRSSVADTSVYISSFNDYPSNLASAMDLIMEDGEVLLDLCFYQYFKTIYITRPSCMVIYYSSYKWNIKDVSYIYKYSCNYGISMFLFIASCQYTWLFNGIRQFLVASIMFHVQDCWLRKKDYTIYDYSFNYINNTSVGVNFLYLCIL